MTISTTIVPVDAANVSAGTALAAVPGREITVLSRAVAGGTIYITVLRGNGASDPVAIATSFAGNPTAGVRQISLSNVKTVAGVPVTAAAQANIFGITFTPGTAEYLISEAANNNTKTDVGCFEHVLSDTYIAATALNVIVNAHFVIGSGTLTTKTVGVNLYKISNDDTSSADLVTTSAQTITGSAADYTFAVTGTTLNPGDRFIIKITMTLTETASQNVTGRINSVRLSPA